MNILSNKETRDSVDVIVRTRNSGSTLKPCLESARRMLPVRKIIVIDNYSKDATLEIAASFQAEITQENTGLGYATKLGISKAGTENIVFLDSDVIVTDPDFYGKANSLLEEKTVGAVVGQASGHLFEFGLPLSLTLMRLNLAKNIEIEPMVMGRETYYMQKHLRNNGYKVRYLPDAMVHNSTHRSNRNWPEWQGAWVRKTSGLHPREIIYSMLVVFLMLSNSRKIRNFLYIPIFQAKLMRGFVHPSYWQGSLQKAASSVITREELLPE